MELQKDKKIEKEDRKQINNLERQFEMLKTQKQRLIMVFLKKIKHEDYGFQCLKPHC